MLRLIYRFGRSTLHRIANRIDSPVVVLLYHRVTSPESDPNLLATTPVNFRAQMEYLKDNFPVLRFEEDWSRVSRPSVVVTFDDGYADNRLEALPILEDVDIPATFFITTGPIDSRSGFWWDEMEFLILGKRAFPSKFELKDKQYRRVWPADTDSERRLLHGALLPLMKKVDSNRREDWLYQLRHWAGTNGYYRTSHRPMTVDDLRMLAKSPLVTIGAHGVTHSALSSLSPLQQKEELVVSKDRLETWLGQEISVFAYPYGDRASYTRDSVRLCNEIGFKKAAAANFPGQGHRWTDPYQIPRQMIPNWPVDTFAKNVSKFWIR